MKKKGLLISTIVMVVVLIAALTTSTYAWFTAESKATISTISISTSNASDIAIGLKTDGAYSGSATAADFTSGAVGFNGTAVTGGDGTLGASIETGISLANLSKAIGTGVVATSVDAAWNAEHAIVKANGTGYTPATVTVASIEAALANGNTGAEPAVAGDYVDWVIGFMPTKAGIDTFTLNITITPNTAKPTLGLLAALHLRMSVNGGAYSDLDVYDGNHQNTLVGSVAAISNTFSGGSGTSAYALATTYKTSASTVGGVGGFIPSVTDATTTQAGAINIAITFGTLNSAMTANTITQLHFQLFYAGYDSDCITSALGVGANIYFTITNTEVA